MSRLPIRLRLTLVFAAVMALVLAALGLFLYARLGATLDERVNQRLRARSDALAVLAARGVPVRAEDLRLAGDEDGLAQVIDAYGSIVTSFGRAASSQVITADELRRAQIGRIVVERNVETSGGELEPARLVAVPVAGGSGRVVLVGESLENRDDALDVLRTQLLLALPLALLLSSVIGYVVAGAALRPMEAMRRQAEEISAATSGRRLPLPTAQDEVYRLGATLNEMLERLDAGLERERRFVADASHELRTPLAILKAELEVALRRPRSVEELESAIRSAAEETDRLVQLAEDLLLVARSDQGALRVQKEPVAVDALLDDVGERLSAQAAVVGRELTVADGHGLEVEADRPTIERALANLVDNALRYGAGTVSLRADECGDRVELHVTDEGTGFDPELLPVAFERFTRADDARTGGGTGLGLAIVDAIARAHGGAAGAANLAAGGADIWISLPRGLNDGDAARPHRRDIG